MPYSRVVNSVTEKPARSSRKARMTSARLAAVQLLYEQSLTSRPLAELKAEFLKHYAGQNLDGDKFVMPDEAHLLAVADGAQTYEKELDDQVDKAILGAHPEKKMENMEILLRLILRCAAFELLHTKTEKAIVINDYVNVARAFYTLKEPAFVNAVLDRLT